MAGGTVYRAGGVTELEGDEGAGTSNSTADVFRLRCLWDVQVGVSGRQGPNQSRSCCLSGSLGAAVTILQQVNEIAQGKSTGRESRSRRSQQRARRDKSVPQLKGEGV